MALLGRLGAAGRIDPSHATLAGLARCSERTVRRATKRLSELGLLRWQQRIDRAGWRTEQISNAYEFLPESLPPYSGGQTGRKTKSLMNQGLTYLAARAKVDPDDEWARRNRDRQLAPLAG
jgi:hypothetical protein